MPRHVGSSFTATVLEPAQVELQVAVAGRPAEELLEVTLDGRPLAVTEHATTAGGRLHLCSAPPGELAVRYRASVDGDADPVRVAPLDPSTYLRPSRYAQSDRLAAVASAELGHLTGAATLAPAVAAWVGTRLSYVPGASVPTDGAVETLLARQGVCRDYAHLCVALLRALDVPARVVSVYAPGLSPMDFHAVTEALVDGAWVVVDATLLAPRRALVRIATGRDAADTAFLTTTGGSIAFQRLEVSAIIDGDLPADDPADLVALR